MKTSYNRSTCFSYAPKLLLIAFLSVMFTAAGGFISFASAETNEHLFFIERSKNKNIVYYDVCQDDNNKLCISNPVTAYWILESGKKEGLSSLEKKYAFGIKSLDLQSDNHKFSIAALDKKTISIEKINGRYRAVTSVNNQEIVLEKVYVRTKDGVFGMPKVSYIDYTGRTMLENSPVKIRVVPN
jgi:hypothetical protein